MNVHPNPYGNPTEPAIMPHPENIPRQIPQQQPTNTNI